MKRSQRKTQKRAGVAGESKAKRVIRELEELADALEAGADLESLVTVRKVRRDLVPTEYGAAQVRRTRDALGVSQAVFARVVGVSPSLVQSWEQGFRKPSKMACRLLDEINRCREHWRGMLGAA